MPKPKLNKSREHRIDEKIIIDCYGEAERAMGWYCYLEDHLKFPFSARCIAKRAVSPLKKGETVDVFGMAPEDESGREMFVMIQWEKRKLAVPLAQLEVVKAGMGTKEAVEDWHNWIAMGYEF